MIYVVVAQPRSGGTMASQVVSTHYRVPNRYEMLNTHRYGYGNHRDEMSAKLDIVRGLGKHGPCVIKVSWFDIKDIMPELSSIDALWFHVERTDPVGMVCSSYLSHISGVFHYGDAGVYPMKSVTIPVDYVDTFFNPIDYGGWYWNKLDNIPSIKSLVGDRKILYNDSVSECDVRKSLFDDDSDTPVGVKKLYPDKSAIISNIDEVNEWVNGYA